MDTKNKKNTSERTDEQDNSGKNNTVTISKDAFNQMKTNQAHFKNSLHNLGVKIENFNKSNNSDSNNNDKTRNSNQSLNKSNDGNNDNKPSYGDLLKKVNGLSQRVNSKDKHTKLTNYAKNQLKSKHMNVSKATLSHLIGKDKDSIDANIKWYEPIYKRASHVHIQRKTFHHKNKENVGADLAKQYASKNNTLQHYLK